MLTKRVVPLMIAAALLTSAGSRAAAKPTDAQNCEAAVEKASGAFLACRLKAESAFATKGDAVKRSAALAKCDAKRTAAFTKAVAKFGAGDCTSTPASAFGRYLAQCAEDTVAAARGAVLPPECGDGAVNVAGEQCDGSDIHGDTCESLGFPGGILACTGTCLYDTTACASGELPASGVTRCWNVAGTEIACAGTGQDGELQAGATLAFIDNGDGTIRDANTGLQWEKLGDDGGIHDKDAVYTWDNAFAHIAALNAANFAGHSDWRMPNVKEVTSIIDFDQSGPAIAAAFNLGCVGGCSAASCSCNLNSIWSSSSVSYNPVFALYVNFTPYFAIESLRKTNLSSVRAVRSGL